MVTKVLIHGEAMVALPTAVRLLDDFPDVFVTLDVEQSAEDVHAKDDNVQPFLLDPVDPFTSPLVLDAWKFFTDTLQRSVTPDLQSTPYDHGLFELPLYVLSSRSSRLEAIRALLPVASRKCSERELDMLFGPKAARDLQGIQSRSLAVSPGRLRSWLAKLVLLKGGTLRWRPEVASDYDDYDVVVNCDDAGDPTTYPDSGSSCRVCQIKAPWIKFSLHSDDVSICPGLENVEVKEKAADAAMDLLPSLADAKINWSEWKPMRRSEAPFVSQELRDRSGGRRRTLVVRHGFRAVPDGPFTFIDHKTLLSAGSASTVSSLVGEFLRS